MHNTRTPTEFACGCGVTFSTKSNLLRHQRSVCSIPSLSPSATTQTCGADIPTPSAPTPAPIPADSAVADIECIPCPSCYMKFHDIYSYQLHIPRCKHISNPLQCPDCREVFSTRAAKSRHMKGRCPGPLQEEEDDDAQSLSTPQITNINAETVHQNHIQNQNNIQNQNIQNIQQQTNNNNINIMVFDRSNMIEFLVDHLNHKQLKQIFDTKDKDHSIIEYAKSIMERPENRLIKKTNLRCSYSKVHTGEDNWEVMGDEDVYPKVMKDISAQAWDLLRAKNEEKEFQFQRQSFRTILETLEQLSDGGYCNSEDDDEVKEARRMFKHTVQMLKLAMFNVSTTASTPNL